MQLYTKRLHTSEVLTYVCLPQAYLVQLLRCFQGALGAHEGVQDDVWLLVL